MTDAWNSTPVRFIYRNAHNATTGVVLSRWRETGHYLQGLAGVDRQYRTYRKDRVVEYLNGSDELLVDPSPPPPPSPKRGSAPDDRPQVLFTGFSSAARAALEAEADEHGLHVVKSVTQGLSFLCSGSTAGPAKLEKARAQGVYIMNEADLHALLETGVLPDSAVV